MNNHPLFQVTNHHGEACGVLPQFDEQAFPGVYRYYFENRIVSKRSSCMTMSRNAVHSIWVMQDGNIRMTS